MTDNEITREKTFSEELPYFKERIKEVFDNSDNPDGYADMLYLSALRDSHRIVRKAEEEIARQKAEIERLKKENEILIINADNAFQEGLNENRDLFEEEVKFKLYKEFAEELKERANRKPFETLDYVSTIEIDDLVKEMENSY